MSGETGRDEPGAGYKEEKRIGSRGRVTRGLESTQLCGLVKGPRGALLKSEKNRDSRSDWDYAEIDHGTDQLQATQAVGESRTHSSDPPPPKKNRTSVARIKVATPAQLRVVDKLLEPKDMGLPDAAYDPSHQMPMTRGTENPVDFHSWPRCWQCMIGRIHEPRG